MLRRPQTSLNLLSLMGEPTMHTLVSAARVSDDMGRRAERHQERINKNKVLHTFNSSCCAEMCPAVIILDFVEGKAL